MKKLLTMIVILALTTTGCASSVGPREESGTLLGAGTGALIGAQFGSGEGQLVAIALGTLAGALIGQDVGRTLDQADQDYMRQTAQSSLETSPSNRTSTWVNPDSGHSGSITPTNTYRNDRGQYCREYQQKVVINGSQQQAYGHACRQADGSWKITAPDRERRRTVIRYLPPSYYQLRYRQPYYPGYYYPAYLWPFTSIGLYFGHGGHWDDWDD